MVYTASEDMDVENISSYPNDSETGLSKSEQIEMAIGHVNAAFLILFFIIGLPWNALVVGIILKKKLFIRPSLNPMTYKQIVTPRRMFFAIVVAWLFCIVISIMPLVGFGEVGYTPDIVSCSLFTRSSWYSNNTALPYFIFVLVQAAMGTIVQLFGCVGIIYIARKHLLMRLRRAIGGKPVSVHSGNTCPRPAYSSEAQADIKKQYNKSQLQLVKVFGAIFTASIITVLPLVAVVIAEIFRLGDELSFAILYTLAFILVLSKSILHPILESYMSIQIREVISMFWKGCVDSLRIFFLRNCRTREGTTMTVLVTAEGGNGHSISYLSAENATVAAIELHSQ